MSLQHLCIYCNEREKREHRDLKGLNRGISTLCSTKVHNLQAAGVRHTSLVHLPDLIKTHGKIYVDKHIKQIVSPSYLF